MGEVRAGVDPAQIVDDHPLDASQLVADGPHNRALIRRRSPPPQPSPIKGYVRLFLASAHAHLGLERAVFAQPASAIWSKKPAPQTSRSAAVLLPEPKKSKAYVDMWHLGHAATKTPLGR